MGHFFSSDYTSPSAVKSCIERDILNSGYRILAKGGAGREYYVATERNGERSITLYLIEQFEGEYSYKPIPESFGPYYYNVPDKVLRAAPLSDDASESARNWRAAVAARKERKARTFNKGQAVTVYGKAYTIVGEYNRSKMLIRSIEDGKVYAGKKADIEFAND